MFMDEVQWLDQQECSLYKQEELMPIDGPIWKRTNLKSFPVTLHVCHVCTHTCPQSYMYDTHSQKIKENPNITLIVCSNVKMK